jgi:gag-polypeptide of LTR copia-type
MDTSGELTKLDTLTKLQTMLCLETDDIQKHLSKMSKLREELTGMGSSMTDTNFVTNIC